MNSISELSLEEVEGLVDEILLKETGKHLSDVETQVLYGTYQGRTYDKISEGSSYELCYVREIGSELWKKLSTALGESVSKTNFMQPLKRYQNKQASYGNVINTTFLNASQLEATATSMEKAKNLEFLGGRVSLDSLFYIERLNVESLCYETVTQLGALIRIRSPQRMGKTSLLGKLLDYARQQGYQTAKLDLGRADSNALTNLNTFLQWLCVKVSKNLDEVFDSLEVQSKVEEYWQDITVPKDNCDNYFQDYLLSNIKCPLVLAIDNCEILFKYPDIFSKFFPLLRAWHENAKQGDRVGKIWRKLRVVLVYSTESYPELDTNHSPFNVGVPIELPDFNFSEVTTLAKQYELDKQLGENGLRQLMHLVGGHPDLIQQALISLKRQQTTLEELLSLAPTEQGIYSHHLRKQLSILQHNLHLKSAYREVVMTNEPVRLDTEVAFKLHSIGLAKFSRNGCIPRYEIYRKYFSVHLG